MESLDSKTRILCVTDFNLKRNIREIVRQTPGSKSVWIKMGLYSTSRLGLSSLKRLQCNGRKEQKEIVLVCIYGV